MSLPREASLWACPVTDEWTFMKLFCMKYLIPVLISFPAFTNSRLWRWEPRTLLEVLERRTELMEEIWRGGQKSESVSEMNVLEVTVSMTNPPAWSSSENASCLSAALKRTADMKKIIRYAKRFFINNFWMFLSHPSFLSMYIEIIRLANVVLYYRVCNGKIVRNI